MRKDIIKNIYRFTYNGGEDNIVDICFMFLFSFFQYIKLQTKKKETLKCKSSENHSG